MKNPHAIIVNYDYIQEVSHASGVGRELAFSEFDAAVDHVLKSKVLHEEINCLIENLLDEFVEDYLPAHRQAVIDSRREDDAYEEYRQKQIDGEA